MLASFFAGLALGSLFAGRLVDRTARPLFWYGVCEILVAALALGTSAALGAVEHIYGNVAGDLTESFELLTVIRFVLSFIVLLAPATLLGASLPIIVKSSVFRSGELGERVSLLYATNTGGAIIGTLVAGFWLIGRYGIAFSFRSAAVVNVIVGVVAVVVSRRWEPNRRAEPVVAAAVVDRPATTGLDTRARRVILAVFTVSGFVTLALEVVWFRVLVLYLDSNTYAFTVMLATVLAGITAGSAAVAPLMRRPRDWLRWLAAAELVLAVMALLSLFLLAQAYDLVDPASSAPEFARGSLRVMVASSAAAVIPATLLMGAAFPVGLHLWAEQPVGSPDETGRRVGLFYSLNVAGGILGSLAAGFVLVPILGTHDSLVLLSGMLLASGIAVAALITEPHTRLAFVAGGTVAFLVTALFVVLDPYRAALESRYSGERLLWLEEGPQTTVSVHERPDGVRVMYLDGLHQANDSPELVAMHREIGALPMALHPDPERALVVGLGGGVTAGAVSELSPGTVDIVELSSEVVDAARFFRHVNGDVANRPNVDIRVDDGRNYQLVTDRRYDVITADIIQPEHAGAGKVWSVEYWRLARDVLEDDGVMLQWIGVERSTVQYQLIMRSFLEVFPAATLWAGGSLMVGTKQPLELSRGAFERKVRDPETAAALAAAGFGDFAALVAQYSAGPDEMRAFVGPGALLTDDHPRIEYYRSLSEHQDRVDLSGFRGDPSQVVGA